MIKTKLRGTNKPKTGNIAKLLTNDDHEKETTKTHRTKSYNKFKKRSFMKSEKREESNKIYNIDSTACTSCNTCTSCTACTSCNKSYSYDTTATDKTTTDKTKAAAPVCPEEDIVYPGNYLTNMNDYLKWPILRTIVTDDPRAGILFRTEQQLLAWLTFMGIWMAASFVMVSMVDNSGGRKWYSILFFFLAIVCALTCLWEYIGFMLELLAMNVSIPVRLIVLLFVLVCIIVVIIVIAIDHVSNDITTKGPGYRAGMGTLNENHPDHPHYLHHIRKHYE